MGNISIDTTELYQLLEMTPADQNIMLVGNHGIGKSEILTKYFTDKGMKVVALFLGQMADPGDLIGLPTKNPETGHTEFMPPYWFPTDDKPIVLFLDELNRARPEILQTVMDLALNRRLAGRSLPAGSRLISAVNAGDQYQLTDLDPALVSRFNIVQFRPTVQEWLLWADTVYEFFYDQVSGDILKEQKNEMVLEMKYITAHALVEEAMSNFEYNYATIRQKYRVRLDIFFPRRKVFTFYIPYSKMEKLIPRLPMHIASIKEMIDDYGSLFNISQLR